MYIEKAIKRINNINWDLVGKNISKSDAYFGYEFLRRLAKFFEMELITPRKPLMTNIADLLGDLDGDLVLSDYCNSEVVNFLGDGMSKKNIIQYYIQLCRYAEKNPYAIRYISVYDPLIKLLEKGGMYRLDFNELEIVNVSYYPLRAWYNTFLKKEPINIEKEDL